jgi:hypothetical protein
MFMDTKTSLWLKLQSFTTHRLAAASWTDGRTTDRRPEFNTSLIGRGDKFYSNEYNYVWVE